MDTLDTSLAALDTVPPGNLGLKDQHTWNCQQAFLANMGVYGTTQRSAKETDGVVNPESVRRWRNEDVLGFADRFRAAVEAYGEYLENMVHDRLKEPQGNRGSDILLMFRLKGEMPSKYREEVKVIDTGVSKDLLKELRAMGQARVVEGSIPPYEVPAKVVDTSLLSPPPEPSPTVEADGG